MTPVIFRHRSGWLVTALVLIVVAGLVVTRWLAVAAVATETALADQLRQANFETLARSFGETEQTALAATVPSLAALAQVYPAFEALAARHGAILRYNLSTAAEQDPTLIQAKAAKDSWVVPIDWLGTRQNLEQILLELETGPYLVKVHRYRFDITESSESVLSTTLILYGR